MVVVSCDMYRDTYRIMTIPYHFISSYDLRYNVIDWFKDILFSFPLKYFYPFHAEIQSQEQHNACQMFIACDDYDIHIGCVTYNIFPTRYPCTSHLGIFITDVLCHKLLDMWHLHTKILVMWPGLSRDSLIMAADYPIQFGWEETFVILAVLSHNTAISPNKNDEAPANGHP